MNKNKQKWDEMVNDLKNTLKKFNIPERVTCEANEIVEKGKKIQKVKKTQKKLKKNNIIKS